MTVKTPQRKSNLTQIHKQAAELKSMAKADGYEFLVYLLSMVLEEIEALSGTVPPQR